MNGLEAALLVVCGTALALGLLALRQRARIRRLRARLESASGELQNLQLAFSRFAPDEVIERVIASGVATSGERKEVTVLFADLVGFTKLSESLDPGTLVGVLNGYFERMSRAITEHRGHVSTFIGDGILAFFGALAPNPWQSDDAVRAALAMRAAIADYSAELGTRGLPPLAIGVGLHRGTGVAGLVGSQELKEFAFVGRTVNVAARVQDLTRQEGVDILITESLRAQLDPRFQLRALPPAHLKGISEPVAIHAVEGYAAMPPRPEAQRPPA